MIKYKYQLVLVLSLIQLLTFSIRQAAAASNCLLNPCKNGAHCQDLEDSFKCLCRNGFTGLLCETMLENSQEKTLSLSCLNMGYKRTDGTCVCVNGFSGGRCQIAPLRFDFFKKNSGCLNGGFQPREGLPCKCLDGFYGFMCEYMTSMDHSSNIHGSDVHLACMRGPCRNGGICTPTSFGSYMCTCRNGFYGYNCENLIYRRSYGGFGSLVPFLLFFFLITMCVYCCCFNKNRTFTQHMINQRQRFSENARSVRFQPNTAGDRSQNRVVYVNTTIDGAGNMLPKESTDLPPSYDDCVKKQTTSEVNQNANPPVVRETV